MKWKITFFNEKVEQKALSFPVGILANFLHIVEMIEKFGPALGKPYTAPMGRGLFEIRAKGRHRKIFLLWNQRKGNSDSPFVYKKITENA